MAFDQAPARRRALQPRADAHKAALSEDGLRGLVLNSDGRQDLDRPRQCEGCVDHRFRRLGRKTLSPGLGRQRKAERKAVFATRLEADGPNRVAFASDWRHHQGHVTSCRVGLARGVDESLSRAFGIGMRDTRGVAGDFPSAAKFMDCCSVTDSGPTQPKPRRLKPEHIVSCQIGKHEITGQRPIDGVKNDEGDAAAASPL